MELNWSVKIARYTRRSTCLYMYIEKYLRCCPFHSQWSTAAWTPCVLLDNIILSWPVLYIRSWMNAIYTTHTFLPRADAIHSTLALHAEMGRQDYAHMYMYTVDICGIDWLLLTSVIEASRTSKCISGAHPSDWGISGVYPGFTMGVS